MDALMKDSLLLKYPFTCSSDAQIEDSQFISYFKSSKFPIEFITVLPRKTEKLKMKKVHYV